MLKIVSILMILVGGSCLIYNYWKDFEHFLNEKSGDLKKFTTLRNIGAFLIAVGIILGIINFLFV